ncbi:permease [Cylindrospermopsis raciborskii S07]|uniref:Permease n=2 Tax=Cylindrospermopsis raciborskii TaxID=77022 RepID=A0A853MLC3_9CYAN|nr:permease [Cylindrospermopsis raciborskii]EFA70139.1 permease [Cylindrospermopsis raciborskii CS-505]OBU78026.1 permease [Cylindrospermopsis raciborskii CS-505]OHY35972.1 permease [Cylindrospermopsis raciborskii CS-508]PNJ98279.1 permease [Cylindrospermopsis raciborskii C03]PNJ98803.1 permease [Cylindrospermopsis raciborskii C04]
MISQLNNGFTLFLSLLVEAMPFLLLGVLFSSLLLFFVEERKLVDIMPKNPFLGALFGSMIGFLFPVCECGNVPVARRLLMQGVPTSVAIGFLLAAPTINPIVIWATWTAFRDQPEIVVLRVVLSLSIATIIGFVFSFQKDITPYLQPQIARYLKFNPPAQTEPKTPQLQEQVTTPSPLLQSGTYILGGKAGISTRLSGNFSQTVVKTPNRTLIGKLGLVLDNAIQELRELGAIMVLGSAIAAAIQVLAPRDVILSLGAGPISSILTMLLLATVVSICSTVDSFFALSFASTFTSGSLLAFLVFGPMIDIKGVGLMLSVFKPKALFYLFALAGQLTLLFTLFLNLHIM